MLLRVVLLGLAVGGAWAQDEDWFCTSEDVAEVRGNICCNDEAQEMLLDKLAEEPEDMTALATAIREGMNDLSPGYWEVLASKADFGFAQYRVQQFHCKVSDPETGATAIAWKVLPGGGGGGAPAAPEQLTDEPPPPPPASSEEEEEDESSEEEPSEEEEEESSEEESGGGGGMTPNEKLKQCCLDRNVNPVCYDGTTGLADLCKYQGYSIQNLVGHYTAASSGRGCPIADLGAILQCAGQGVDHTACCEASKLAGVEGTDWAAAAKTCDLFCYPEVNLRGPASPKEFACGTGGANTNLDKIKNCFISYAQEGEIYLPERKLRSSALARLVRKAAVLARRRRRRRLRRLRALRAKAARKNL